MDRRVKYAQIWATAYAAVQDTLLDQRAVEARRKPEAYWKEVQRHLGDSDIPPPWERGIFQVPIDLATRKPVDPAIVARHWAAWWKTWGTAMERPWPESARLLEAAGRRAARAKRSSRSKAKPTAPGKTKPIKTRAGESRRKRGR